MNWEAIGAIGEVVGAVGVIATLAYLTIQIRQNSSVVRSATRQAISTTQMEVGFRMAESPEARATLLRWTAGEMPSTPDQAIHDDLLRRSLLRMFENQFHQYRGGTFDHILWEGYRANMAQTFSWPTFEGWWRENQYRYAADFVAFVDEQIHGTTRGARDASPGRIAG